MHLIIYIIKKENTGTLNSILKFKIIAGDYSE
jgi:hypothetical protein